MSRNGIAAALCCAAGLVATCAQITPAGAQVFSARRMAMGGVVIRAGNGLTGANVAYRAVPAEPAEGFNIPLPLGLVQLAMDPPVFDVKDSSFNAFRLANLLYDLPWNYRLSASPEPSSDIAITVGQNNLIVDLGDVGKIIPKDGTKISMIATDPSFSIGHSLAVGIAPLIHYQTDFTLNSNLYGALANAEAFVPNTDYAASGTATAQAAVGLDLSYARALIASSGDPREHGGLGIYAGARAKLLRGLLYDAGSGTAGFRTPDTLFGGDSIAVNYNVVYRTADPAGGGIGYGLDLGAVCLLGPLEVGVGVNDVHTELNWHVREEEVYRDTAGNRIQNTLGTDEAFTSTVPTTVTANVLARMGSLLLAADAIRTALAWTGHLGAEQRMGGLAVRGGLSVDENQLLQYAGGTGYRFGPIGLDLAIGSNSHNLSRVRVLELGAGLTIY
ncbi:MAG: hypothetical protein ACRENS_07640 [Candidatus Eiseniibacteriota bacterium]